MSATSMLAPSTSSSTCGQSRKVARTSAWNWRYATPLLACGRREYSTSTYSDAECRFEADGAAASEAVRSAQCRALQHSAPGQRSTPCRRRGSGVLAMRATSCRRHPHLATRVTDLAPLDHLEHDLGCDSLHLGAVAGAAPVRAAADRVDVVAEVGTALLTPERIGAALIEVRHPVRHTFGLNL